MADIPDLNCGMSDGWYKRAELSWDAPLYWSSDDSDWYIHTLLGTRLIDPSEPVCHISFYEADAYATYRNFFHPPNQMAPQRCSLAR